MTRYDVDVAIIGAGPAGAVAAGMLASRGLEVLLVEASRFPRFSIGESLLPQVTECLVEADMLEPVASAGFQHKDGAFFACADMRECFDFADKTAAGPGYAWEVKRAEFDHLLALKAVAMGAGIHYDTRVVDWRQRDDGIDLSCENPSGLMRVACRFLVDASGFGRVLARLANLETPSPLPPRRAIFHHVQPCHLDHEFDRNKITIAQAAVNATYWFWFIPFADGTASFGLVGDANISDGRSLEDALQHHVDTMPLLKNWLRDAGHLMPPATIVGYSCNVKRLFGDRYVLLGNAGEFVDPIFSSGVSIACRSAVMAAPLVERAVRGERIDWEAAYDRPLRRGVNVFRVFVEAWYNGTLPRLIYARDKNERYRRYISSILAGYVWDDANPFTRMSVDGLTALANIAGD